MDESLPVGRCQSAGDLRGIIDRPARRERTVLQRRTKRLPFEQFGDEIRRTFVCADIVNGEDVRMIERAGGAGLLLESPEPVGVFGELFRQHFDGDVTPQPRVVRSINFSHAARAERGRDLIHAEPRAGWESARRLLLQADRTLAIEQHWDKEESPRGRSGGASRSC